MLRRFIATASIFLIFFIVLAAQPGQQAPPPGQYPPTQEHPPGQVPPQQKYPIESLKGAALYTAYCASCHGRDGEGNGPTASALKVAPPNLTTLSQRHGGTFPRDLVEKIILGENEEALAHGSREMPVWGPIFGQIEWDQDLRGVRVRSLSDYLESIQQRKIVP